MAGQVGFASETTFGTPVTVDKFVPVLASNLTVDEGLMRPRGIRAARRTLVPARLGPKVVSGQVRLELPYITVATLLKHMFGSVNTTGAGPYVHTATPGSQIGTTKSLTLQVGINDITDTVRPFTASGVKVAQWELACQVGEFATLSLDWVAKDIVTATALATASYATGVGIPFTFVEGSVSVAGSPVATARAMTLRGAKNLKTDRHVLGSRTILEQLEQERFEFSGSVTCDFESLTQYAAAAAATEVAIVETFSNGVQSLVITMNGQLMNVAPSLTSNGLEEQTLNFEVGHATSDASAITAVLTNSDAVAT
jgi:hypothetical protein